MIRPSTQGQGSHVKIPVHLKTTTFDTGSSALAQEQRRSRRRRSFPWIVLIAHFSCSLLTTARRISSTSGCTAPPSQSSADFLALSPRCTGFSTSCYVAAVSSANPPEQTWKSHCAAQCAVNQSAKNSSRLQPDRSDQWEGREFDGPMGGQEVDNKDWRNSDQTLGPRLALGRSTAGSLLHRRPLANLTKQDNPPALLAKSCRNV